MAQYTVESTKSTWVQEATPNGNNGTSILLFHTLFPAANIESFVGFNILENVPLGSVVASAGFIYTKVGDTEPGTIRVRAVIDAWNEDVLTWNLWVASGQNVGTAFTDIDVVGKGSYLIDVMAVVQEIVDNQYGGNGFHCSRTDVRLLNSNQFTSDDNTSEPVPALIVVYTPPPAAISPVVEGLRYGIGPKRPQRTEVKSSYIASTQYDGEKKLMAVQFKNGRSFLHYEVPEDRYAEFMSAESKGRYYLKYIRGVYAAVPGDLD